MFYGFGFPSPWGSCSHRFFDKIKAFLRVNTECFSYKFFQCIKTLLVYTVGVILFCGSNLGDGLTLLGNAVKSISLAGALSAVSDFVYSQGSLFEMIPLALALAALLAVEAAEAAGHSVRRWVAGQNLPFRWAVYLALIFMVLIFGIYGPNYDAAEFIYAGF